MQDRPLVSGGSFGLAQGEALRQQTERLSKRLQRLEELGGAPPK